MCSARGGPLQEIVLAQQTPVRVAKRRADLVRTRTVHTLRCDMVPVSSWLLFCILHGGMQLVGM